MRKKILIILLIYSFPTYAQDTFNHIELNKSEGFKLTKKEFIFLFQPTIIAAFTNFKYLTHLFNWKFVSVFHYKLENFLSFFEKMPTAFFNISRSNSASLNRFSKS